MNTDKSDSVKRIDDLLTAEDREALDRDLAAIHKAMHPEWADHPYWCKCQRVCGGDQ